MIFHVCQMKCKMLSSMIKPPFNFSQNLWLAWNFYLDCVKPYLTPTPTRGSALTTRLTVAWSGKANITAAEIKNCYQFCNTQYCRQFYLSFCKDKPTLFIFWFLIGFNRTHLYFCSFVNIIHCKRLQQYFYYTGMLDMLWKRWIL